MRSLGRIGLLAAALILVAPRRPRRRPFSFAATPGALPKDVLPIEYALHLVPDVAARTFRGSGSYRIEVLRPTRRIVLHALQLEVASATLRGPGRKGTALGAPKADAARQLVAFTLPKPLPRGRYTLELAWRGKINASVEGLYADPYPSPAGPARAARHRAGARRRAPPPAVLDEPSFRARFRVTVDLPPGFSGFSNMPVARREALAGGGQRLAFAPTPPMPSYLLALVAGELERVTAQAGGTELGVVVTAGKAGRAQFALDAGAELLGFYGDYFGTRYPLPKLDQIGVPGGFGGAMENWGAIVYTEAVLLVDPLGSPEKTRQLVYGMVAHEVAHQWLGNLVTMAWWDDLWLNESLADWMTTKASERFHPSGASRCRPTRAASWRWASTRARARIRSTRRSRPRARPSGRSTASPTRRAAPSCACSRRGSARRPSAAACATISRSTRTPTPRAPTSGAPSPPPRASRSSGSPRTGRPSPAFRSSRSTRAARRAGAR
jgi:aminopeptidase N